MKLENQKKFLKQLEQQKNLIFSLGERNSPSQTYKFAEMVMESPFRDVLFQEAKESYKSDKIYSENNEESLIKANHTMRRLALISLWNDINRIEDIYFLYNPRNYEAAFHQLKIIEEKAMACSFEICDPKIFCIGGSCARGSSLKRMRLEAIYEGLKQCIDPESGKKSSYDEFFDMDAYKIAIHNIYNRIVDLIENKDVFVQENNKLIVSEKEGKLFVECGELKNNSLEIDTQIAIVIKYAANNNKIDSLKLWKILSKEKVNDFSSTETKRFKSIISDVNRWLKKKFKITTALRCKLVGHDYNQNIVITHNKLYW